MALTTILEEQTVTVSEDYITYDVEAEHPLVLGETYTVVWDGTEYECEASEQTFDGTVYFPFIGNPSTLGGEDNGVPFGIMYGSAEMTGASVDLFSIAPADGTSGHTVAIYQKTSSGGDSTETLTTIFEEQTVEGFVGNTEIGFAQVVIDTTSALVVGESYKVLWDGAEVTLVAIDTDGFPCLDNEVGGFVVMYLSPEIMAETMGTESGAFQFFSMDTTATSHTVGIYQVTSDDDTGGEEEGGDEGTEEEQEGIILKDRNGNNVAYYGIETLTLDTTTEGKQQKYTKGVKAEKTVELSLADGDQTVEPDEGTLLSKVIIQRPDSLQPEIILSGHDVAGVSGAYVPITTEEKTVNLDFSEGDMTVEAESGKAFSKVSIPVPENLVPEILAEGMYVAGIGPGTHSGGGGGDTLCVFAREAYLLMRGCTASAGSITKEITQTLPIGSKVLNVTSDTFAASASSASTSQTSGPYVTRPNRGIYVVSETSTNVTVTSTVESNSLGSTVYYALAFVQTVFYTTPGFFVRVNENGDTELYTDSSATQWRAQQVPTTAPTKVDLSQSLITTLPNYMFDTYSSLREIILPAGTNTIGMQAIYSATLELIDASRCTKVPSLTYGTSSVKKTDNLKILVPSALYNTWISASGWSSFADHIVAV